MRQYRPMKLFPQMTFYSVYRPNESYKHYSTFRGLRNSTCYLDVNSCETIINIFVRIKYHLNREKGRNYEIRLDNNKILII